MKTELAGITEKTQKQITTQMEAQRKKLVALEDITSKLLCELEQIIIPPLSCTTAENPEQELVPLANMLRKNNCCIEHIVNNIKDLIDRIEL